MARVTGLEWMYIKCSFCGELVQPISCGWKLRKMKCPSCRKKCYRQTFKSGCPVGSLFVGEEYVFQET